MIRTVLHFVLFDIISSVLFLKVRAKYLPVDSWMFHYSFSQFGNFQILMDCLTFFKNKIREKVSIIFNYLAMNISSDCVELQVSVLIILFSISSSVTYWKKNVLLFIFSLPLKQNRPFSWFQQGMVYLNFENVRKLFCAEIILPPSHYVSLLLVIILFEKFV